MKSKNIFFLFFIFFILRLIFFTPEVKGNEEPVLPIPSNLTASSGHEVIMLHWDHIKSPKISGFNVYRKTISKRKRWYKKITARPITANYFINTGLDNGKIYYYSVKSVGVDGSESEYAKRIHLEAGKGQLTIDYSFPTSFTLPASSGPYVIDKNITVFEDATLTIEKGITLLFKNNGGISVKGVLHSKGATFTSFRKNAFWEGIKIKPHNRQSTITGSTIKYAKTGITLAGSSPQITKNILIQNTVGIAIQKGSSPEITNNEITQNKKYGISIRGGNSTNDNPIPVISENSIFDNGRYNIYTEKFFENKKSIIDVKSNWWGTSHGEKIIAMIYDFVDNPRSSPTVYFNNFLTAKKGAKDKTSFLYGSVCTDTILLPAQYEVIGNLTVCSGATLTISPNTIFTVSNNVWIHIHGRLFANGLEGSFITFTTQDKTPAPGRWDGIAFIGPHEKSEISFCIIENAKTAIRLHKSSPFISECTISHNITGIELKKGSSPKILKNKIINNRGDGIHMQGDGLTKNNPMPTINYNYIYHNRGYNIYSMMYGQPENTVIDARKNNWDVFIQNKIKKNIYDYFDNKDSPKVDFAKYW